jgi:thioredoxin reductase
VLELPAGQAFFGEQCIHHDDIDIKHDRTAMLLKELRGKAHLEQVIIQDRATGEEKTWQYDGMLVFIGLSPNSDLVKDKV